MIDQATHEARRAVLLDLHDYAIDYDTAVSRLLETGMDRESIPDVIGTKENWLARGGPTEAEKSRIARTRD